MDFVCSNTQAAVQCFKDMTYDDCFQLKLILNVYDSTIFQPAFDAFCSYTNELSDIFWCVATKENLEWFIGCIDNMFMGIIQTKTGQTYIDMEEYQCSKDGTRPAINDLSMCLTEHMEGRCDKDVTIFVREKSVDVQKYSCLLGEKISKQYIMFFLDLFQKMKKNYAKLKLQNNL